MATTRGSEITLQGFKWLIRRWYIPLIALAAALGWFLGRQRDPGGKLRRELESIERGEEIERLAVENGAKIANRLIDEEHRKAIEQLTEKQRRKADALRSDPARRIRYLRGLSERLGR